MLKKISQVFCLYDTVCQSSTLAISKYLVLYMHSDSERNIIFESYAKIKIYPVLFIKTSPTSMCSYISFESYFSCYKT